MGRPLGVLLASLLALSPPSLALVSAQDDAGSGRDAPDRFEDALAVAPGHIAGRLDGHGLDADDWFQFDVKQGEVISASARQSNALMGADILGFRLITPRHQFADFFFPGFNTSTTAAESGSWRLHVFAYAAGAVYAVDLAVSPPLAGHLAGALQGFRQAVVGLQVGEGGSVVAAFHDAVASVSEPQYGVGSIAFSEESLREGKLLDGAFLLAAGPRVGAAIRAGPAAYEVREPLPVLDPDRLGAGGTGLRFTISQPGTYYFVGIATSNHSYASFDFEVDGPVSLLGSSSSDVVEVLALTDFHGGSSLQAPVTGGAGVGLEADVRVKHVAVGFYYCKGPFGASVCSYSNAAGANEVPRGTFLLANVQGTWSFKRDYDAEVLAFDDILVILADVALPW